MQTTAASTCTTSNKWAYGPEEFFETDGLPRAQWDTDQWCHHDNGECWARKDAQWER